MDHGTDARPHDLTARLLGLEDSRVLTAAEVGGELEVLIETTEAVTGCRRCGGARHRARPSGAPGA